MTPPQGSLDPEALRLGSYAGRVENRWRHWQEERVAERIWGRDPTLWPAAPPKDVANRMGWLDLPTMMPERLPELLAFAEEIRSEGFRDVVILGMGGSSLAPDVLRGMFGHRRGYPNLSILDSTHPAAVAQLARRIDPKLTLFVVSSKSGTTTEPLAFYRYFWEKLRLAGRAPERQFAAITDPDTPLEKLAREEGFRAVFLALPTVGGRYSALTMFGLVPAVLMGIDVGALLENARRMAHQSGPSHSVPNNPGLALGAILGEMATHGRDKITLYASMEFAPFPMWAEQLVAESTGKLGKGMVPIVDEPRVGVQHYGNDRVFLEFHQEGKTDPELTEHLTQLSAAGHPIVRLTVSDPIDVGQEFFRWELAVASSAMVLGIDPYDQPDVELAKDLARKAMASAIGTDLGPDSTPTPSGDVSSLSRVLRAWMVERRPREYFGIQAYLPPTAETSSGLERLRKTVLENRQIATTSGYGPRFLHSTGQLHKGGPNNGLFLQLVDDAKEDIEVPGAGYTFGQIIRAQALGDFQALRQKDQRVLRVSLENDILGGLRRLNEALDA